MFLFPRAGCRPQASARRCHGNGARDLRGPRDGRGRARAANKRRRRELGGGGGRPYWRQQRPLRSPGAARSHSVTAARSPGIPDGWGIPDGQGIPGARGPPRLSSATRVLWGAVTGQAPPAGPWSILGDRVPSCVPCRAGRWDTPAEEGYSGAFQFLRHP